MNTTAKLSAYGAVLALIVTGAFTVGTAVGPLSAATASSDHSAMSAPALAAAGPDRHGDAHNGTVAEAPQSELPGGLASSANGYTLAPQYPTLTTNSSTPFTFAITGPGGAPVTAFDVVHDKPMHLIVVRRDGSGFQHLHPQMAPDGTWSVPLTVPSGGSYRAFADFTPTGGAAVTLGVDLAAAGEFVPLTHTPSRTAQVDGYTVELTGDLVPGQSSTVALSVTRDESPVTDLQPYLGSYGHLVSLRQGDLAYLHVHPDGAPGDGATAAGPQVQFAAEVPTAGTYRLFFDFQHGDVVRTAEFTVPTVSTDTVPAAPQPEPHGEPGHGH